MVYFNSDTFHSLILCVLHFVYVRLFSSHSRVVKLPWDRNLTNIIKEDNVYRTISLMSNVGMYFEQKTVLRTMFLSQNNFFV